MGFGCWDVAFGAAVNKAHGGERCLLEKGSHGDGGGFLVRGQSTGWSLLLVLLGRGVWEQQLSPSRQLRMLWESSAGVALHPAWRQEPKIRKKNPFREPTGLRGEGARPRPRPPARLSKARLS